MDAATGKPLAGLDHLRQSIACILSTPIGSRVCWREFGSLLPDLIDQPMNPLGRMRLLAATAQALLRWEPRLRITSAVAVGIAATPIAAASAAPAARIASMTAPAGPIEIHIHPPAGSNATDIARAVRAELEKIGRENARATRSTMTDPPDWSS